MAEPLPHDSSERSRSADFELERLRICLHWVREHFLSFVEWNRQGQREKADIELNYLDGTTEEALSRLEELEVLLRAGHLVSPVAPVPKPGVPGQKPFGIKDESLGGARDDSAPRGTGESRKSDPP